MSLNIDGTTTFKNIDNSPPTVQVEDGTVDHDALLNFVSDEHVDWNDTSTPNEIKITTDDAPTSADYVKIGKTALYMGLTLGVDNEPDGIIDDMYQITGTPVGILVDRQAGGGGGGVEIMQCNSTTVAFFRSGVNELKYDTTIPAFTPNTDTTIQLGNVSKRFQNLYIDITPATAGGENVVLLSGLLHRASSDERVKKNITSIGVDWTKFNAISPKTFNMKTTAEVEADGYPFIIGDDGGMQYCGFIAQNLNATFPDCARVSDDGMQFIDSTAILAQAVRHIQDLQARITVLEGLIP